MKHILSILLILVSCHVMGQGKSWFGHPTVYTGPSIPSGIGNGDFTAATTYNGVPCIIIVAQKDIPKNGIPFPSNYGVIDRNVLNRLSEQLLEESITLYNKAIMFNSYHISHDSTIYYEALGDGLHIAAKFIENEK